MKIELTNLWTPVSDLPSNGRSAAVGFSIGNKGYLGTGGNNEFWEYIPRVIEEDGTIQPDQWTQLDDVPGGNRTDGVGFAIAGKGYIGLGQDKNDFYEFDPIDGWRPMESFPGGNRSQAIAFVLNDKAYVGLGQNDSTLYEFDPTATPNWRKLQPFPKEGRNNSVGFSIEIQEGVWKGYVGMGTSSIGGGHRKNVFEFIPNEGSDDPINLGKKLGRWKHVKDFGPGFRRYAVAFSIGNKAYVGTGRPTGTTSMQKDIWEFDPSLGEKGEWSEKSDFGGLPRIQAVGFSIGQKGYIGTGNGNVNFKDFWEYLPDKD